MRASRDAVLIAVLAGLVVLPAAIDETTGFWRRELLKLPKARAMAAKSGL